MKRGLWYSVVVRDRHGKIVSRESRKSKSFLKQWNQLVYVHMIGSSLAGVIDTDGTPFPLVHFAQNFGMDANAGVTANGIRVGTGNTAVAIDDHALDTPIEEGIAAGQMEHLVCNVTDYAVVPPSCSFIVSRTVLNNSGVEITAREAGCYSEMWDGSAPLRYCCLIRDIFGSPQAVPHGGSIVITYTLRVTV